jgi:sterol desaturase/sphingolipid hydroxylase (fatty acid hydroxylase superfamily)
MDAWWQPLVYALLAGCAFAPLEWLLPERDEHDAEHRHDAGGRRRVDALFASVGALITHLLLAAATGLTLAALAHLRPYLDLDLGLRGGAALVAGFLLFELAGYAYHRAAHTVPALWRLHAVHHSAPRMDWLASFRQHPIEIVLMTLVQNVPLVLLGVPLGAHALIVLLLALGTVYVHANLRIDHPALRWLVATPRFHHRHHAREGAVANYAALLPILDRMFGTYADDRARSVGLDEPAPRSFVGLLVWPFSGSRMTLGTDTEYCSTARQSRVSSGRRRA